MQTRTVIALLLAFFMFSSICHAKVWKVNLSSNYNGRTSWGENLGGSQQEPVFKNLQQVVDFSKVSPGDTIHVAFVNASYGNVSINKRLVIIGDAYPKRLPSITRAADYATNLNSVSFIPGSEGSQFLGFNVKGEKLYIDAENITIGYSIIEGSLALSSNASGANISYNFFKKASQRSAIIAEANFGTAARRVVFNNNILQKPLLVNNVIFREVKNNIIDAPSPVAGGLAVQIRAEKYANNILKTPNARIDVTRGQNLNENARFKKANVGARGQDCTEPPAQPGFIPDMETCNTTVVVEIDEVEGATSYTWDAPSTTIVSGQGTNIITFQIDPGFWEPTVHTISVVAENECGVSVPRTFSVSALPDVDLEAVLIASFEETCEGNVTGFVAVPNVAETYASYQWRHNSVAVGTNNYFYEAPVSNGDFINCQVSANVCGFGVASTNTIVMSTWPSFTPMVEIFASSTNICAGQTVTFSAIPTAGGDFPMFEWQVNGLPVAFDSPEFSTNTLQDGDKVIVLMVSSELCVTNGHTVVSPALTITVNPVTTPSVSISASATEFCPGTNVTITATPTNGGTTPQYQWKVNGANVGTNSSTFTTATLDDGDEVTCVLTSSLPCATSATANSNSIVVTVNPPATPTISINASANDVCEGTEITFTAQVTDGGASPTYQWKVNGADVGTNQATFSSNTLSDGDEVTCELISSLDCTVPATSNTIVVNVGPGVSPAVTISASTNNICAGTEITFTAQPTNGGTSPTYQWKVNGANVGTNQATFSSSTLSDGDDVTCEMISNAVCAPGTAVSSNVIEVNVIPVATPSISIAASATNVCAGEQITFTAQINGGGTGPTYIWRVNGAVVGSNQSTFSSTTLNDGDQVICELISNASCTPSTPVTSNTIIVEITQDAAGSISIAGTTTVIAGDEALLTSQLTGVAGNYIQQWQDSTSAHGWQDISGATTATLNYSPAATGDKVRCVLTSTSSCGHLEETVSNELVFTVNIPRNKFRCYPNPTDGMLRIDRLSPDDQWRALDIINIVGARVSPAVGIAGQAAVEIDIRHLTPGVYIIRLTRTTGTTESIKILKR